MNDIKLAKGMLEDVCKIITKQVSKVKESDVLSNLDLFYTSVHAENALLSIKKVIENEIIIEEEE